MESGQAGIDAIAKQMRKDKGIPDSAFTTPGEIGAFESAMKAAQSELIPIISDGTYQGVKAAMVEVWSGTSMTQTLPQDIQERLRGDQYGDTGIQVIGGTQSEYKPYQVDANYVSNPWNEQDAAKYMQQIADGNTVNYYDDMRNTLNDFTSSQKNITDIISNGISNMTAAIENINKTENSSGNDNQVNKDSTPQEINLNINVSGFENVEQKVAEAGAELIEKALPDVSINALSY